MSIYQSVFPAREDTVEVQRLNSGNVVVRFACRPGYSAVHLDDLQHFDEVIATLVEARTKFAVDECLQEGMVG